MYETKDDTGAKCHKLESQDYDNATNKGYNCCGCINWCDGNCYSFARSGKCEFNESPLTFIPM